MLQFDLTAQIRDQFGKGAAHRLRRSGLTPAVLYGHKEKVLSLELDTKELTNTMLKVQRRNAVFNLRVNNQGQESTFHVMVREMQTSPTSEALIHADFCAIALESPLSFTVPVVFNGKAKGVDMGGDLAVLVRSVVLKGRPLDVPEFIEKDISDLGVDEKYTCGDLNIPANVELVSDKETVCVSVSMPVKVAVAETAESAAAKKGGKKK